MRRIKVKKKILVTGAGGFIGSHLVKYLIKNKQPGDSLRLLIPPWGSLGNLPNGVFDIAIADIRDKKAVDDAAKNVDIIYHLAAKTIIPKGSYSYYKDTNVDGTANLLDAAKKYAIKKFIFFSSISVFGLPAYVGDVINCNESWPKKPSEPYGRTKLEAEKLILKAHKNWGLNYIIIRPTTVYGPRDKAGIFQLLKAIDSNYFFFIGDALNKMDYVYVDDLVSAARIAELEDVNNEDFIIGSVNTITQKKLVQNACYKLGKPLPKIHILGFLALGLAELTEYFCRIFGIKPLLFPERVKVLLSSCYFDSSKARELLGYHPSISFEKGINITIKWMRRQKIIK